MSLGHGFSLVFPWSVWECWWLAPLALVLDLWLGDPALPWRHPVCIVGRFLDALEGPARCFMATGAAEKQRLRGRLAGAAALAVLTFCTGLAAWSLTSLPLLALPLAVYLGWSGLAMGSLLQTGRTVLERVEHAPVPEAREALSWLVSRETGSMDRPLMRKTLADTLSENLTDAFTAPFFWLLVGGPVALWCYKAASTTDSMWGYTTDKWRWLGWAGARADDALAFIPARLAALSTALAHVLACLCARLAGAFGRRCVRVAARQPLQRLIRCAARLPAWPGRWPGLGVVARQAVGMPSPNSGWSMTACAWLCWARMAGPSVYFGVLTPKPWLGPSPEDEERRGLSAAWDVSRLSALCSLLWWSALCGGLALWLTALLLLSGTVWA
ncbi:CobD/CbiB family cobalamin biosynthesis protein [Desulfovibrio sp. G11]|uniref:Cobalamin biosynthesis protein CobD n=1 Tax=Desulfovibrio desulfuricans TaxID=876 RepID=A0AA94L126_DESDE|nr:CobD/CbiB family cobalamin biosynthesis protein [Desulfovibrio sp. G11]SFW14675.1 adenosylcobinamide-phosphate synthase [Desulfovibrio desulfuricans]SPD35690.1 threonine-phosphate decarboxylase [Desulfovibrio sp. G11]